MENQEDVVEAMWVDAVDDMMEHLNGMCVEVNVSDTTTWRCDEVTVALQPSGLARSRELEAADRDFDHCEEDMELAFQPGTVGARQRGQGRQARP